MKCYDPQHYAEECYMYIVNGVLLFSFFSLKQIPFAVLYDFCVIMLYVCN